MPYEGRRKGASRAVTEGQIVHDACHLYEMARRGKSIEAEDRQVNAGAGEKVKSGVSTNRYSISF